MWRARSANLSAERCILFLSRSVAEYTAQVNIDGPAIVGMNPATDDPVPAASHDKEKPSQSSSDTMGAGTAAGITFGVTALAGLLIAAMVIGWRRHRSVKRESSDLTEPLNSLGGYGAVIDGGNQRV